MIAPVYKVSLEDGTEVKCTGNHRWLTWTHNGGSIKWMRTDEIKKALENKEWRGVGRKIFMPKPFDVVEQDLSYESGYLGGLFDGEGHLSLGQSYTKNGVTRGMQIHFTQRENAVFKKGVEYLEKYNFDYSITTRKNDSCKNVTIKGGVREVMRALQIFRPERLIQKWGDEKINNSTLRSDTRVKIESVAYLGEQEIITLESSTKTYIAEGFCAHNTMLMESELRAIDPPYLSSDIEAPSLVFGQKKVIPVTDVDAYKQIEVKEPSNQFFTMMNSLSETMTSQAQGGAAQIIPSRQPKAAREILAIENMKQQTMSASLLMYYDLVYQEIMLVLKTALQFYATGKYDGKEIMRTVSVPNFPLAGGGIGQLEVRIKKEPSEALNLYFESINKSIENGKTTEIIEISPEILNNLEWFIDNITLEPEKTPEMERAQFFEQVMTPMMNLFIPMGLADPAKVFLRYLEKYGESPSDYASDQILPMVASRRGRGKYQMPQGTPQISGREGQGQLTGNINQSLTGMQFGNQSGGGFEEFAQ